MSPAIVEQVLTPGQETNFTITISNNYEKPRPIIITVQKPQNQDGSFVSEKYLASDWIDVSEESFVIPSGVTKKVTFTVSTPAEEEGGGRYANIIFRTLQLSNESTNSGSSVVPEIQVPVLLTVPGDIVEQMEVSLKRDNRLFIGASTEHMTEVYVYNSGNIHNIISPEFTITSKHDDDVDSHTFTPTVLLPGASRTFPVLWTSPSDAGVYYEEATVSYGTPSKVEKSEKHLFISGQPLSRILSMALLTWLILFIYFNHSKLRRAFYILFME